MIYRNVLTIKYFQRLLPTTNYTCENVILI